MVKPKLLFLSFLFLAISFKTAAQDSLKVDTDAVIITDKVFKQPYDPLAPSRAAFYSAVLPGLGQAYNKKYWKIPIIYGGLAAGIYFWNTQNDEYNRFRDAYKRRLAGFTDDEFFGNGDTPLVSEDRLIDAQRNAQKNRDIWTIVTVGIYLINIVDANVDAHLRQYNVNDDLSFTPTIQLDPMTATTNFGVTLRYSLDK